VKIQVVRQDYVVFPHDQETIEEDTKVLLKEAKDEQERYSQYWQNELKKTKDLEAQVKALKKLCPESHKKEEEVEDI
jgi:hypothetical protein